MTALPANSDRCIRVATSNVLMHIMGFIKEKIDTAELLDKTDKYRHGHPPDRTHHASETSPASPPRLYTGRQYYLKPHPEELMLRNSL